jgi:hypothetical protein
MIHKVKKASNLIQAIKAIKLIKVNKVTIHIKLNKVM